MAVRQIVNLLRGSVELEVSGTFPERFLNLCAQTGVPFWGTKWPEPHKLRLTVSWWSRRRLEDLAQRTGCRIEERGQKGIPPFLLRFRRRYAFLIGLAFALLAVCFFSRFVLVVEVEGNKAVPTQVILAELRRSGLRPGVFGPDLAVREISNEALLHLDGLSWMTINLHGIRAQVVVREKAAKPDILDESIFGDIVAKAPGMITQVEVYAGDAAVQKGATVLPGDVLIRGSVKLDPPQYSENPPEWVPVRAMGKVEGRTWRILRASIPLEAAVKEPLEDKVTQFSITCLGQRINFYQNSRIPFDRYDKITDTWNLTLPGGFVLPFALRRETCQSYQVVSAPLDASEAQDMLEQRLNRHLQALLGETGTVVQQSSTAVQKDGVLTVTLKAECREELGRFQPAS